MIRSQLALVVGVVLAVSGCAQQPRKDSPNFLAQAARYGVSPKLLYAAENQGYWPKTQDGKTLFCRSAAVTGSSIAAEDCVDATQLQTRVRREADEQRRDQDELQKNHGFCPSCGS